MTASARLEPAMKRITRKHVALDTDGATPDEQQGTAAKIAQALLDLVSEIPTTREHARDDTRERADEIVRAAKSKAALTSGSLALPPGPLGWLTLLPEIYAVWKIQAQMVSDLAALHGRKSVLTREQMLYCLFRHTGAQLFRDIVMRVGERYLVKRLPIRSLYSVANKIGIRITQRSIGRAVSRVIPVAGALGVAGYSWYDTRQVAKTALELFRHPVDIEPTKAGAKRGARTTHAGGAARKSTSKQVAARRVSSKLH
jgi:hypothetical protein